MNGDKATSIGSGEEPLASTAPKRDSEDDETMKSEEDDVFPMPEDGELAEKNADNASEDMDPAEKQALIMSKLLKMPIPVVRSQLNARWLMLFLLCMALIGSYYCYDNPTAIHNQLSNWYGVPSNASDHDPQAAAFNVKYNLLYSVYSFPNTVLPFFGGVLSDRLGVRLMAAIFAGIIALGQLVFAIGLTLSNKTNAWYVMYLGRTIFGLGGESLSVAMSAMIAQWFSGKELALALGMNLALARVGSVINDEASQAVAEAVGTEKLYWVLWVGLIVCVASFGTTLWAFFVDRSSVKRLRKNRVRLRNEGYWPPILENEGKDQDQWDTENITEANIESPLLASHNARISGDADKSEEHLEKRKKRIDGGMEALSLPPSAGNVPETTVKAPGFEYSPAVNQRNDHNQDDKEKAANGIAGWREDRGRRSESVDTSDIIIDSYDDLDVNPEKEEVKLGALFGFPPIFWVLTLSCLTVYCTVLPFNNIASRFITKKWLEPEYMNSHNIKNAGDISDSAKNDIYAKSNTIMMSTYLVAGLLSPFMGALIDKIGYRALLNLVAAVLIVGVHLLLGLTHFNPIFPLVVLGVCYSIYASALWPSIALVIEPELQGTAYGVVTAVQNAGLAISPIIIGKLTPPACDNEYTCVEMFFVGLGAFGVLCGIILNLVDCTNDVAILNLSEEKARERAEYVRGEAKQQRADEKSSLLADEKSHSFGNTFDAAQELATEETHKRKRSSMAAHEHGGNLV